MAEVPLFEHEADFLIHFRVGEMSFLPAKNAKLGMWERKPRVEGAKRGLCPLITSNFSTRKKCPGKRFLLYDFMKNSEMSGSSPFKMRLVHLDLKGAPPKVSYLSEVFPLFHALGANGLLLEYEDMFPYDGRLRLLRAKHAYRYPQPQREQGHRRCRRLGEGLAPVGSPLLAFRLLSELQK